MTALDQLTDEQFERHALGILARELGPAGLARFLRLHRWGPGDYTQERQQRQSGESVDTILQSIERRRNAR